MEHDGSDGGVVMTVAMKLRDDGDDFKRPYGEVL